MARSCSVLWQRASIIAPATSGKEFVDPIGPGDCNKTRVGPHMDLLFGRDCQNIYLEMLDCLLLTSPFSESSNKNVKYDYST